MNQQPLSEFNRLQGIAILICLAVACIATNIQIIPTMEEFGPPDKFSFGDILMLSMIGIVIAQPCILTIWFSFSPDSLPRRGLLFGLGFVAVVSAWLIGVCFYGFEVKQSISRQLLANEAWGACFIPVAVLMLLAPMFLTRQIFGTSFQNLHQQHAAQKQQFTIKQILLVTFVIAAVLACSQAPFAMGAVSVQESTGVPAIFGGIGFGVGLFVLLPFVLATMRNKGFWLWSLLFVVGGSAAYFGARSLYTFLDRDRIPNSALRNIGFESTIVAASLLTVGIFLGGLSRLGYRIGRGTNKRADKN